MSDDEKFYFKGGSLEEYNQLTYENAKDIIACGFNPDKTFIFSNLRTLGGELYANVVRIMTTTCNQMRGIYGLTLDNTVGQMSWPCFQCAPAYSNSFPDILHPTGPYNELLDGSKVYIGSHIRCLVPMAIDQDPYFRMARDFADRYHVKGYLKPATIHSKFLVGLGGIDSKMSSTNSTAIPTIYMTDDVSTIPKKINKYAFSGGGATLKEHIQYGGNLEVDVSYQWLLYFLDDDEELQKIAKEYSAGTMSTGQIKKKVSDVVCELISKHQNERDKVTNEVLRHYFNRSRKFDHTRTERPPIELESDEVYATYGINFDPMFGTIQKSGT